VARVTFCVMVSVMLLEPDNSPRRRRIGDGVGADDQVNCEDRRAHASTPWRLEVQETSGVRLRPGHRWRRR